VDISLARCSPDKSQADGICTSTIGVKACGSGYLSGAVATRHARR
jgi:hypothetical protein